ncbi:adenosylhomocysteine nucleosidase [Methylohalomonas lacus]|uniref:Adenosylhomocysteine nucleosidase n=1 Tax=Methylohalomonas lacus TaxID=398773 RepID=A0AAE3HJJ5_9GAMM|nr:phosphorylase [Methylohalomonas lacus]MCS3902930.1 adenosylhomocysteine nucleosidase [Methylohalomonas lacus]
MSNLGIIAALPAEGRLLCRQFSPGKIQPLPDQQSLLVCGIGARAAARAACTLIEAGADHLLSWGCAAGLRAATRPGDLFLPRRILTDAGARQLPVDPEWHTHLATCLQAHGIAFDDAALIGVEKLLTDPTGKQELAQQTDAAVADMESAAIADVAREHALPFLCIRAVADNYTMTVPAALTSVLNDYGQADLRQLTALLLRQPQLLPQLLQLGRAFSRARRSLANVRACDITLGLR